MNNSEIKFVFCTECGAKNEANANFCTSCGSKLVKTTEPPAPVVIPTSEESTAEDETPATTPVIEESVFEETVSEETEAEIITPEESVLEDCENEETQEEDPSPEVIPEADKQTEVEAIEAEAMPEETVPEAPAEEQWEDPLPITPVVIPEDDEPREKNVINNPEGAATEEKKEEEVAPVVVPVIPKVSKKEAKLEKKLEEAKKQAQEQALKEAKKAEDRAKKAEAKAEKAEEKARKAEEKAKKAEKTAKKAAKQSAEEPVQNNSYYYNRDSDNTTELYVSEKPKKKRRQNFFLKFLSFLLALILMASLAVAVPITLLNLFLTDHNIDVIVDRAISSIELDKIEFSTADGAKTLSGALHDITNEFEGWDHITEEQINDALLEDFVKQFVSDTLTKLGMALMEGEATLGWTPEEIYGFIESNKDTIEELARDAGYEGKLPIEEKKDMMIANIEEKIGKDGISASALLGDSGEAEEFARYLDAAQALFSINILYLAWGLVAFIVVLIIFTNIGYFGAFCRTCGFPAFIIGALYFLAGLGVSPLLSIVTIPIPIVASAIEFTAGFLGALLMDISLIVLAVGFALVVISFISDAIRRKIDSKNNA